MSIPSEEEIENAAWRATEFLRDNAEKYAELKARLEKLRSMRKRTLAVLFIGAQGSVETRKSIAEASQENLDAMDDIFRTELDFEKLKALMDAARIKIDLSRSHMSTARALGTR